jgi:hypothetical protein
MNSMTVSVCAFIFIFFGALFGLFLRSILPEHHLGEKSRDAVKVGIGLIATLTALVLGLLVSSAKDSFDTMASGITQGGAKIILADRVLARYGPETNAARAELHRCLASGIDLVWPQDQGSKTGIEMSERRSGIEEVHDMLRRIEPHNEYQRLLLQQALGIMGELSQSRWLVIEQLQGTLPRPFLVILILWLTVFFICFGLLSEPNTTVIMVMLVCALSVAGAIFLILEMNDPLQGIIKVSSAPLRNALSLIGQQP